MLLLMTTLIFFTDLQKVWCRNNNEYENFCMEFTSVSREIELDDETLTQDNNQAITVSVTSLSQRYSTDLSYRERDSDPTTQLVEGETHNVTCNTTAEADIVVMVDGFLSLGHVISEVVKLLIARLVGIFDIGPDHVQIGLTRCNGLPSTWWHLNAHRTKHSLLKAVANLSFKEEYRRRRSDLTCSLHNNFKAIFGMRPNSRKIAILITDRKLQSDIYSSSQSLHNSGIELYAIGVMETDYRLKYIIVSYPVETYMFHLRHYFSLRDIVEKLTNNLCPSIKGQGL